jgi:hypothetical protein
MVHALGECYPMVPYPLSELHPCRLFLLALGLILKQRANLLRIRY